MIYFLMRLIFFLNFFSKKCIIKFSFLFFSLLFPKMDNNLKVERKKCLLCQSKFKLPSLLVKDLIRQTAQKRKEAPFWWANILIKLFASCMSLIPSSQPAQWPGTKAATNVNNNTILATTTTFVVGVAFWNLE